MHDTLEATQIDTHEVRTLTVDVALAPADQWEQDKKYTAMTFRVERAIVTVTSDDQHYRVSLAGPRILKRGFGDLLVDKGYGVSLLKAPQSVRDAIDTAVADWRAGLA